MRDKRPTQRSVRSRPLKLLLDARAVQALAQEIERVFPRFATAAFIARSVSGLASLELTPRAWHIADALHAHLPQPFTRAADVLLSSLGPELPQDGTLGVATLAYMPHVFYVQKYGLADFEAAMRLQYELTKRFSAESSIRAFLLHHHDTTYERLVEWTRDENMHVRRLVSEGTRPRLPWAPRLRGYQENPEPVIRLLELLKDDPQRYVQRSVANNLNDISKDHPEVVVSICRRWLEGAPPGRVSIVRHALRTLVKRGHRGALALLGAGGRPRVEISSVTLTPRTPRIGDRMHFSCVVTSTARAAQDLVIDYAVHFVKANGQTRPRVFKLRTTTLAPNGRVELRGSVSLEHLSTRRHYAGRHRIELLINGRGYPLPEFDVRPAREQR